MRGVNSLIAVAWLSLALSLGNAFGAPLWPSNHAVASDASLSVGPFSSFVWQHVSALFGTPSLLESCLVQTCAECQPYWTTELGKYYLFWRGVKYMDLTSEHAGGYQTLAKAHPSSSPASNSRLPHKVAYHDQVSGTLFKNISEAGPRANLAKFTSFYTRHYRSATGRQSQAWLKQTVTALADGRPDLNISVSEWPHAWGQNSIILHVPGSNVTASDAEGVTIVGAHQDSTNSFPFLAAPGADDDGSGTVTILEALRALLATTSWKPITDVEFHWYSAEEGGLLGSQEVVRGYVERGAHVKAMLQQDMTAFVKAGTQERIGLPTDFVDDELRSFVQLLINDYLDIPAVDTKLGYAASDHASWNKAGYRSAFAIEAPFEDCNLQRIHTRSDTFDHPEFSFDHLLKFVRLTSAFIVELAGWSKVGKH